MTIGNQLERIFSTRLATIGESLNETAIEITEQMKENSKAGRAFANDPYADQYSKKYSKRRVKLGLNANPTILRAKSQRIERTTQPSGYAVGAGRGVEIGFVEAGRIFKLHHDGTAKGGKIRSIFPKWWASVPADIYQRMVANIIGALRG